jgi:hypothetical protein
MCKAFLSSYVYFVDSINNADITLTTTADNTSTIIAIKLTMVSVMLTFSFVAKAKLLCQFLCI